MRVCKTLFALLPLVIAACMSENPITDEIPSARGYHTREVRIVGNVEQAYVFHTGCSDTRWIGPEILSGDPWIFKCASGMGAVPQPGINVVWCGEEGKGAVSYSEGFQNSKGQYSAEEQPKLGVPVETGPGSIYPGHLYYYIGPIRYECDSGWWQFRDWEWWAINDRFPTCSGFCAGSRGSYAFDVSIVTDHPWVRVSKWTNVNSSRGDNKLSETALGGEPYSAVWVSNGRTIRIDLFGLFDLHYDSSLEVRIEYQGELVGYLQRTGWSGGWEQVTAQIP